MADHEKVISVSFDTTKAQSAIKRLESLLTTLGKKASKAVSSRASTGLDAMANRAASSGTKIATGLKKAESAASKLNSMIAAGSASTIKTRTQFDKTADRIKAGADKAGAALDRMMRKADQSKATRSNRLEKALNATANAAKKTDAAIAKMNAKRGERQKAAAIRAIERRIRRVGSASRIATTSVGGLIAKIGLFIGVASKIREVVTDWMDFDRIMVTASAKFSKLESDLAPGTEAFDNLKKEMRDASKDTEHTAAGVARAVDFWAKAGKSSEITRASIPATLDFASANTDAAGAVLDVARAGDILSDVLGQFRLNSTNAETHMENLARVSDVMSAAANSANFSADELFESYKGAGPVLRMVGSDIEETSSLLAVMANAGIKGSIAGTQLKMAVSNLSAPTGRQEEALKRLGITLKDSKGNFRGLTAIIGDLNKATDKMGSADRAAIISDIIGRRALPAFVNLLSEGQANLDEMTKKLRSANGETKRLADLIRSSASAQMQKFWNKITDLGFTIIENTKLFDKLGKAVDGIDWEKTAKFVSDDLVPALVKTGDFIVNVLWPGFKHGAELLEKIFAPALWIIEKALGSVTEGGNDLATAVGILIAVWGSYRGALVAVRAIDMVAYFSSLLKSIAAATVGQKAFTASTVEGTAAMGSATTAASVLNTALGVVAAAVAGWTIGTIIFEELVDPLMRANHEMELLRQMVKEDMGEKNVDKLGKSVLYSRLSDAEKLHEKLVQEWEEIKIEQLAIGEDVPEKSQKIIDLESHIQDLKTNIAVKSTEENVKKYEQQGPIAEEYMYSDLRDKTGASIMDWQDTFQESSFQASDPIRVPIVATPEPMTVNPNDLINWSGDEMSVPIAYPDTEIFKTGRSEMPVEEPFNLETSGAYDQYSETWSNMLAIQQQTADETREYQRQMVDSALKSPVGGTKTVNQTNNITHGSTTINAPGVDAKEIERILRRRDRKKDMDTIKLLDAYISDAEETEF